MVFTERILVKNKCLNQWPTMSLKTSCVGEEGYLLIQKKIFIHLKEREINSPEKLQNKDFNSDSLFFPPNFLITGS